MRRTWWLGTNALKAVSITWVRISPTFLSGESKSLLCLQAHCPNVWFYCHFRSTPVQVEAASRDRWQKNTTWSLVHLCIISSRNTLKSFQCGSIFMIHITMFSITNSVSGLVSCRVPFARWILNTSGSELVHLIQ